MRIAWNKVSQEPRRGNTKSELHVQCLDLQFQRVKTGLPFHLLLPIASLSLLDWFCSQLTVLFGRYVIALESPISSALHGNPSFNSQFHAMISQSLLAEMPTLLHVPWPKWLLETTREEPITFSIWHLSFLQNQYQVDNTAKFCFTTCRQRVSFPSSSIGLSLLQIIQLVSASFRQPVSSVSSRQFSQSECRLGRSTCSCFFQVTQLISVSFRQLSDLSLF